MTDLDRFLDSIGVRAPAPETPAPPRAACYAPPQWKPTYTGEDPPF